MNKFVRRVVTCAGAGLVAVTLSTAMGNAAFALPTPPANGQPNAECGEENALRRPGRAMQAPGSPFNLDGQAGKVYAGEQPQNSKNSASVSQYDVACLRVTTNLTHNR